MPYSPRAPRARPQRSRVPQLPPLRPVVIACVLAWSAGGALACDAGDTASLAACVANVGTDSTINLTGNITLAGNIGVLAGNATINGNGFTIDGADTYRGFFVGSGNVNINNVTLANLRAGGGAGGTETNPGGGGMGAGGAVFVRSGAAVTLDSVQLLDNAAIGGAAGASIAGGVQSGGGGGMGGAGGGDGTAHTGFSGQGGGGLYAPGGLVTPGPVGGVGGGPNGGAGGNASSGQPGGDYSGGGGGGSGPHSGGAGGFAGGGGGAGSSCSTTASGGAGGFGGGGGGAACATGGAGGFGGGGGSGSFYGPGGTGGFGGGSGTANRGAGGGAGMGGAVFVQEGGALTVSGTTRIGGNSVSGGAGSGAGTAGSAFGSGIFLQGAGGTLTFGNGNQVVGDVIADQAGSGGAGATAVAKSGTGTLRLETANTYTGGTTVSGGTLEIANTGALGTGRATVAGGTLRVDTSGTVANNVAFEAGLDSTVSAAAGQTVQFTGVMQVNNAPGPQTVMRFGSATDTGTILLAPILGSITTSGSAGLQRMVVGGGTLRAMDYNLGFFTANSTSVTVDAGATLDFNGQNAGIARLEGAGSVLNSATTTIRAGNFAGTIAGSGSVVKDTTGTLVLTGNNTYTGTTTVAAGTLQVGDGGTSGNLGSGAIANNGSLVFNRGDTFTVGNAISGTGTVTKAGTGTLRIETANTYTGGTTVSGGTLEIANTGALGTGRATVAGGTLRVDTSGTVANNVAFEAGLDSTVSVAAGQTVQFTGVMQVNNAPGPQTVMRFGSATDTGTILLAPILGSITTSGSAGLQRMVVGGGTLRAMDYNLGFFTANSTSVTVDAGATLDFNGQNAGIARLEGAGSVLNSATTTIRAGTFAGTIAGSGSVVKDTTGTLVLTGNNTYTGTTTVAAGTLQVGDGGTSGNLGSGAIDNNGSLVFNRGDTFTVGSTISGTGTVTKAGTGTTILTGNNTYTGGTTIQQGTLQVGNGGTSGSIGSGAIANNGSLVFNRSDTLALGDAISGTGSLTQAGTGTLRLDASNSHSGGTTIAAGTLEIADAGALGSGRVTLAGGTLRATASATVANALAFAGNRDSTILAAAGQTLALTGHVSVDNAVGAPTVLRFGSAADNGTILFGVSGGSITSAAGAPRHQVVVAGGTLRATNPNLGFFTSIAGGVTVDAGATLDFNGNNASIASLSGAGRVLNTAAMTRVGAGNFAGTIEGTDGLVKYSAGTLVLTGDNSYAGGTTIQQGTLQVGDGGTTGTLGTGPVANNGALVFNRSDATQLDFGVSGTGSVRVASGSVTLTATNTYSGGTTIDSTGQLWVVGPSAWIDGPVANNGVLTFSRAGTHVLDDVISGTGVLQLSQGTFRMTADHTYTGQTNVGGTLELGNGGTTGSLASSGVNLMGPGASLTVNRADDFTLGANVFGTGSLTKLGTNTLTLTGSAVHQGGTTIAAGTLRVGDGGTTGSLGNGAVVNNGALVFDRSNGLVVGGAISGSGSLTQAGSGTVVLTGNNTYTGATTIERGTLWVGNGGTTGSLGTGAITNDGILAFQRSDAVDVTGAIAGSGSFVQAGAGTTTFTGANSYAGTTTISAGTLRVGNGGTSGTLGGGAVRNDGTLVFDRSDTVNVAQAITGTGNLVHAGAGTLVLTGANALTGGTTIAAGTLQVGDGGIGGDLGTGAIRNDGVLAFRRSDAVTLSQAISGSGRLDQAGAGTLVLEGHNTYTGGTRVEAGTLRVNGSIVGATTVGAGGTLGGNGRTGSVTVRSGGTLSPGNSIGALSVGGNLHFDAGSTYRVEANPAGEADRVDTLGAGTITIAGGTVDVRASGAGYQRNTRYTILRSDGGTTGQFDAATSNLAFLTPTLAYEGNAVVLNLQSGETQSYATAARTPNQRSVATYLDAFANAPGNAEAAGLIQQIDNLDADRARAAFDALAGTAHATASQVAGAVNRNFSAALAARSGFDGISGGGVALARLASVSQLDPGQAPTSDAPVAMASGISLPGLGSAAERGFWAQAVGGRSSTDSDGNGAGFRQGGGGFVFGYDRAVSAGWRAGAAVGYTRSSWDADLSGSPAGNGRIDTAHAGIYGRYTVDRWRLHLDATVSDHRFDTERDVAIGSSSLRAESEHRGRELGFAVQADYAIDWGTWQLRPLAGLRHARLREDGFSESGAGAANLAMNSRTMQSTTAMAGMNFTRLFDAGGGLELRAIATRLMGDNDSPVNARLAGQAASFTTSATPLKRNALVLGTTASAPLAGGLTGYADAAYEYRGAGQKAWQLTAGVRKEW